ncbi:MULTISPECIES: putative minor capsid protein [unclassified Gemella]|uniref:putative minor capsid protein n=1 Tax=unclassified Gemella TaxID=2624949 RepID=UPI0015CFC9B4|nr:MULTISPECIES: putative minor capsid protein [unclassified Gemella]MBF0709728.1 capsid protein [Gemella sp. GL1.1]NYS27072.1 capsid protein [Gemella sp. GL1]
MIDKRLLTDSVTISLAGSKNEWGEVTYQDEFELSNVRFDRRIVSKDNKTTNIHNSFRDKPGIIFIYPKFTPVTITDEWLDAIVKDEYSTYRVVGYSVNKLYGDKVFSYEVEVV